MSTPATVVSALNEVLSPAGFNRDHKRWLRSGGEVDQLVALQKSSYGGQHYVNFALWLNTLGVPPSKPREHLFHISLRGSALPGASDKLGQALDLENQLTTHERHTLITGFARDVLLPLADKYASTRGVAEGFAHGELARGMVLPAARSLLANVSKG